MRSSAGAGHCAAAGRYSCACAEPLLRAAPPAHIARSLSPPQPDPDEMTDSLFVRSIHAAALLTIALATVAAGQQTPATPTPNSRSGALTAELVKNVRFRLIGPANTSGRV